jgi:phospholipid transport system substrate-binding protein
MMFRRRFLALAFSGWAFSTGLNSGEARAQANRLGPEAMSFIRDLALQALDSLTAAGLSDAQRYEEFRALLNAAFDLPYLGQFALGRFWRTATEDERAEYMLLFEESLVVNYADRFKEYDGDRLRVLSARPLPNDEALVNSELPRVGAAPVHVAWRVRRDGASFKVIDVTVEGVSMSITQRDDYAATIQRSGGKVSALLAAMREKNLPTPAPAPLPPPAPQGGNGD